MKVIKAHHMALKCHHLTAMGEFYGEVLRLDLVDQKKNGEELRSLWFKVGDIILMIEKEAQLKEESKVNRPGWDILVFQIEKKQQDQWRRHLLENHIQIEDETDYTLYFRDPEGNRLGLSWY